MKVTRQANRGQMVARNQSTTLFRAAAMKVSLLAVFTGAVVALWCSPSLAFGGCVEASPENPTLILGLLGGAVAALPTLRAWLKSRQRK